MPHRQRSPSSLLQLRLPAFLAWYVAGDGVILQADGTAAADYSTVVASLIGRPYREALADCPAAIRRVERAMAGETVAETSEMWGAEWFSVAAPSKCGWGVDGWTIRLPEGVGAAEPDGIHSWLVLSTVRNGGAEWNPGDMIRYNGRRALHVALCDPASAMNAIRRNPGAFEYLLPPESSGPPRLPAFPTSSSYPGCHLAIVR